MMMPSSYELSTDAVDGLLIRDRSSLTDRSCASMRVWLKDHSEALDSMQESCNDVVEVSCWRALMERALMERALMERALMERAWPLKSKYWLEMCWCKWREKSEKESGRRES